MSKYFVYMYMDQDNSPFYIGKGKGQRYQPTQHMRNNRTHTYCKIKSIGVDNVKIHFLHKDITDKEACSWERYWIKYFGRLDNGTGQLTNHTDGGESNAGRPSPRKGVKLSAETKRKISIGCKGKRLSLETKRKMSEGQKGRTHAHSNTTQRKISETLKGRKYKKRNKL